MIAPTVSAQIIHIVGGVVPMCGCASARLQHIVLDRGLVKHTAMNPGSLFQPAEIDGHLS
jgi:hypothetical protein